MEILDTLIGIVKAPLFIFLGAGALAVGARVYFDSRKNRERVKFLLALANGKGWQFSPKEFHCVDFLTDGKLPLFNAGHSRRAHNVLSAEGMHAFDYVYGVGTAARYSKMYCQTPVAFSVPDGALVSFVLSPRRLKTPVYFAGSREIRFEEYPVFSEAYRIASPRAAGELKPVFSGDFIRLLETEKDWHIQSDGKNVLFFKTGGYIEICDYENYLVSCRALFDALSANFPPRQA
jgi:hypothetical protein